ncbi:MAG TPA: hypothetical protein VKH45_02365 [Candidatus Acidoferrum sp.]|nr:hypothetical protein [Candidatus Acidoferrum sp.]
MRHQGASIRLGMLAASVIAIFIIPALFYMIERLGGAKVEARIPEGTGSLNGRPKPPESSH